MKCKYCIFLVRRYQYGRDRVGYVCKLSETRSRGELTHAELLSNRISELEDKAPSDPVGMGDSKQWFFRSNIASYIEICA